MKWHERLIIIIYILAMVTYVYAADYGASQKVDGLADVSGADTVSTKIPAQDMNDTDKIGYTTIQSIIDIIEATILTPTANWVNTTNPWADNEVADILTVKKNEVLSGDVADLDVAAINHYGGILNNDGQASQALEFDLDAAVAGMSFSVVIGTDDDNNTYVHPNGAENMYLDGTAIGVNERIVNAGATSDVGDTLSCIAITTGGTTTLHCYTVVGLWADSGDDGD